MRASKQLSSVLLVVGSIACGGGGKDYSPTGPAPPPRDPVVDSLTVTSAQPPNRSVLPSGQPSSISGALAYQFATAQGGTIQFSLLCFTGSQIRCLDAGLVSQVAQAAGTVPFSYNFTPPGDASISLSFSLTPEGASQSVATARLRYQSSG